MGGVTRVNRVLLITGATSDVGMGLLEKTHHNYDFIYLQYCHMNERFSRLVKEIGLTTKLFLLEANFLHNEDIFRMIETIKDNGVIPNNIVHLPAPKIYNKQFHKDKWMNYEKGWQVSFHSIVEILQAFIPFMVAQHYGRIVFMLTNSTLNLPVKFQASYVSIKYALLGLMKSLSVEYVDKGITVNGISPDMMSTKFLSELPEMIIENNVFNSPLKRNIYVEEVIPVFELILSDLGTAITGQNIGISGGL